VIRSTKTFAKTLRPWRGASRIALQAAKTPFLILLARLACRRQHWQCQVGSFSWSKVYVSCLQLRRSTYYPFPAMILFGENPLAPRDVNLEYFGESKYVYHYTSAQRIFEHILPTGKILLNTIDRMNDPKEAGHWAFNEYHDLPKSSVINMSRLLDRAKVVNRIAKLRSCVFCVTTDTDSYPGRRQTLFYRGFARPRMWAQYADNHTGVCLMFDREMLHQEIIRQLEEGDELFYSLVSYEPWTGEDDRASYTVMASAMEGLGIDEAVRQHVIAHKERLLYLKAPDWSSESEGRWLMVRKSDGPAIVSFGDSLQAIFLGSQFDRSKVKQLTDSFDRKIKKIYGIKWPNGLPGVYQNALFD